MFTLGLVEYLTLKMGCEYHSDLHYVSDREKICRIVNEIPTGQCTRREWQDAAQYLADVTDCKTAASARAAVLAWAGGKYE